jgi:hypothetical protein
MTEVANNAANTAPLKAKRFFLVILITPPNDGNFLFLLV